MPSEVIPLRGRRRLPQILEAAAAGFAQKGYAGASVADLTNWTGLGRGALYRQIGSKAELLRMIAERYVWALEVATQQSAVERNPREALLEWAKSIYATQAELNDFARVFYNERRALDPATASELDTRLRGVGVPARAAIAKLCGTDDEDFGHAFLGMVFGSYLWFRPEQGAGEIAKETLRIFLDGVRAPSSIAPTAT
jgi:AcrR family transcriptional regulator